MGALSDAEKDAILRDVGEFMVDQIDRIYENLRRVKSLILLYKVARTDAPEDKQGLLRAEILRAAVVFLHASLEDFLRVLSELYLPHASRDKLDHIPMVGTSRNGRAEKFLLGTLVTHRDKTVKEVIEESVRSHLERKTFNNVPEVLDALDSMGISKKDVEKYLPKLGRMMKRRHQIVHRADRSYVQGVELKSSPISPAYVQAWTANVEIFMKQVLAMLFAYKVVHRLNANKLLKSADVVSFRSSEPSV